MRLTEEGNQTNKFDTICMEVHMISVIFLVMRINWRTAQHLCTASGIISPPINRLFHIAREPLEVVEPVPRNVLCIFYGWI